MRFTKWLLIALLVGMPAWLGAITTPAAPAPALPPGADAATAAPPAAGSLPGLATPLKSTPGCLSTGNGFLRAKIRGALTLDLDLHDAELECDGGPRPDGSGIRVSFAGPVRSDGRRLRMVFGVVSATEGKAGKALPTNLTVIFEGEQRMFATRGDDKCTVDKLSQERVGDLDGPQRTYRIIASGFCIVPINALGDKENIVVNSFDFAGGVTFEAAERDDMTSQRPPAPRSKP
jgi:hypothetical protein